jgi:hypothetical protein
MTGARGNTGAKVWLLAALLAGGGCASFGPVADREGVPQASRCYSEAEVARIEMLRERGEEAATVAAMVGGTAADVRSLERRQRALAMQKIRGQRVDAAGCPERGPLTQAPAADEDPERSQGR